VTCPGFDRRRVHAVEDVDHLEVAELLQPGERVGSEALVQAHDRRDSVPVVVDGIAAAADDDCDGLDVQCGGHARIMANECA
jgi:hypothetical protein